LADNDTVLVEWGGEDGLYSKLVTAMIQVEKDQEFRKKMSNPAE